MIDFVRRGLRFARTVITRVFWRVRLFAASLGRLARRALRPIGLALWAGVLLVTARLARRHRAGQRLYWGPEPIINNKYFSDALRETGYDSVAVASHDLPVFKATHFDLYHDQIVEQSRLPGFIARRAPEYVVFLHLLRNYDIVNIPFTGGPLGRTPLASLEPRLLRLAGIRTVMVPFGGDFLRYSWIMDTVWRHAMLIDYPEAGRNEDEVDRRVNRWMKRADVVVGGLMIEGAPRWDVLATNYVVVPPERVRARQSWSGATGEVDPVTILHAPNHRGVKGTEFIIEAVEALKRKGHAIDFVLMEKMPNEQVLETMRRADICIDHCIGGGYGLFAIEAMGSGAAVVANLEDDQRLNVHRYFGWLDQCPIVSSDIVRLEETIEHLLRNAALREELGRMGVEYVRRFHSPQTAQHLFGSVYRSLAGEQIDLLMLFHPISSEYMRRFEPLRPPLRRNRPPELD